MTEVANIIQTGNMLIRCKSGDYKNYRSLFYTIPQKRVVWEDLEVYGQASFKNMLWNRKGPVKKSNYDVPHYAIMEWQRHEKEKP
jgi:hypothetical protein